MNPVQHGAYPLKVEGEGNDPARNQQISSYKLPGMARGGLAAIFLGLIVLAGLAVAITVWAIHPHRPKICIQDIQILDMSINNNPIWANYNCSQANSSDPLDSALNSDMIITVLSYNRNHHLTVINTEFLAILKYNGREIGRTNAFPHFHQSPRNTTLVQSNLAIRNCPIRRSDACSLHASLANADAVVLESKLGSRTKFKLGSWKSAWHKWFHVKCHHVVSSFASRGGSHLVYSNC